MSNVHINIGSNEKSPIIIGDKNTVSNSVDDKIVIMTEQQLVSEYIKFLTRAAQESSSQDQVKEKVQKYLQSNPQLKERLIGALRAGFFESIKIVTNNPAVSIPLEMAKGWIEGS